MSTNSSIDVKFCNTQAKDTASIVKSLMEIGWNLRDHDEQITFLPVGDIDEFNWCRKNLDESEFFEIVKEKEKSREMVGVILYWNNSDVGITTLVRNIENLSFSLNINRVKMKDCTRSITDTNWYLKRTVCQMKDVENFAFYEF